MNSKTAASTFKQLTQEPMIRLFIPVTLSVVLVACGESDLKDIRTDVLAAAQQQGAVTNSVDNTSGDQTTLPATDGTDDGAETPAAEPKTAVETLLESYSLVFSDEFNGATLSEESWNTSFQWGTDLVVNNELQYYVDTQEDPDFGYDPFVMTGSELVITGSQTPPDSLDAANGQNYLSGVITTQGLFDFEYGYAEIRAKVPTGRGFWPGFWMLGTEFVELKPQLYVMENRGDNASLVYHRYNYTDADNRFVASELYPTAGENYDSEFHTYGVEWTADEISWYVDGTKAQTLSAGEIPSQSMYLILNLAVGGWFPESPNEATEFPGEFVIDYVRVYQQNP